MSTNSAALQVDDFQGYWEYAWSPILAVCIRCVFRSCGFISMTSSILLSFFHSFSRMHRDVSPIYETPEHGWLSLFCPTHEILYMVKIGQNMYTKIVLELFECNLIA